jgi:hypothetical protein
MKSRLLIRSCYSKYERACFALFSVWLYFLFVVLVLVFGFEIKIVIG